METPEEPQQEQKPLTPKQENMKKARDSRKKF